MWLLKVQCLPVQSWFQKIIEEIEESNVLLDSSDSVPICFVILGFWRKDLQGRHSQLSDNKEMFITYFPLIKNCLAQLVTIIATSPPPVNSSCMRVHSSITFIQRRGVGSVKIWQLDNDRGIGNRGDQKYYG